MLEALKEIAAFATLPIGDQGEEMETRLQAASIAQAAVAKAQGGEAIYE